MLGQRPPPAILVSDRLVNLGRVQSEMQKNVDSNPLSRRPKPLVASAEDDIRRTEQRALDGWSKSSFHATGLGIVVLLAVAIVIT